MVLVLGHGEAHLGGRKGRTVREVEIPCFISAIQFWRSWKRWPAWTLGFFLVTLGRIGSYFTQVSLSTCPLLKKTGNNRMGGTLHGDDGSAVRGTLGTSSPRIVRLHQSECEVKPTIPGDPEGVSPLITTWHPIGSPGIYYTIYHVIPLKTLGSIPKWSCILRQVLANRMVIGHLSQQEPKTGCK